MAVKGKLIRSSGMEQSLAEANASGVSFVLTELGMTLIFIDVARTSHRAETVRRNHQNALEGYRTVQRFLPGLKPSAAQRREIDEKLAAVRTWLVKAGYQV